MRNTIKKILLCALSAVTLCGCSAKLPFTSKTTDFDKSYTVTADITCGELEAKADVTRVGSGEWEFSFTEPKELAGIKLSLDESGFTASLGAFSVTAEPNAVYTLIPDIISQSVDSLPEVQSDSITEKEGVLTLNTELGGKKVTITASKDTGELISLKCPYYKLAVYFSGQAETAELETEDLVTEECGLVEE